MTDVTVDESGYTVSVSTPSVGAVSVVSAAESGGPVLTSGSTFDVSVVERPTGQLAIDGLDPGEYIKSLSSLDSKIAVSVDGSGNATVKHNDPGIATTAYAGYPTVIRTDATGHIVAITVESDKEAYRTEIGLGDAATRQAADFLGVDNTTLYARSFNTSVDAAAARSYLGLGNAAVYAANDFAFAVHTHAASDTTSGVFDLARIPDIGADKISGEEFSIDLNPSDDRVYSIGTEDLRWLDIHGDLDGAVTFRAKNDTGATLNVGDVVYINGLSGETPTLGLADASSAGTMPAFGVVREQSLNNAETHVVTMGSVYNVPLDPASFAPGDIVYVSTTAGELTTTKPSGESNLVQNIGYVVRAHATSGVLKVGGAGRTNAVPNLNDGNIFIGNASNDPVSTPTSSVDLSVFNCDLSVGNLTDVSSSAPSSNDLLKWDGVEWSPSTIGLADLNNVSTSSPSSSQVLTWNGSIWGPASIPPSTDWKLPATSGGIIRLFEDFMGSANRNFKSHQPFFSIGTSSAFWDEAYDYSVDTTGVVRAQTNATAYARAVIMGPHIYNDSPTLGDEWMVEMRLRPEFNASSSNVWIGLGSFSPKSDHNTQTTEQVRGYGDTAKAGIYWVNGTANWYTSYYDNEGTNGSSTDTATAATGSNSTWMRVAVHCRREEYFTIPVWATRCYIDGVLAGSPMYNLSGTRSPTFSFLFYNGADAIVNNCLIDWMLFQYRRPNAVTYIDMESL